MRKHLWKVLLVAAVAALVGVGATVGTASNSGASKAQAGGTYRVGWESSFGFSNNLDPTGEYLGEAFGILSNLLVRTLVGYNHVAGAPGNVVVPDLATSIPTPTNGGKTYTFKLKPGVMFGPPLSRAITSKDVAFAMQRLADPKGGGQYSFYYGVIQGWSAAKGKPVSGIKTPNASTIVFNLTQATGDFLYRMAMPAAGPIPAEVAKCFTGAKANSYGRNLVSSGPYMIEGSDEVDTSSCSKIKPASGYEGADGSKLTLVRNPDYNAKTDSKAARENFPDRFEFTVNANADDIFNRVKAGDLDDEVAGEPPKVLREYSTNASLKSRLKINVGDRTWYLTMNLTQPPFDDIHIRKAMNLIMDKDGLRKAWGGPTAGEIATHIVPDPMLNNLLKSFDPYSSPGHHGSVAKAMAEIKQSKYDTNKDGTCDAPACKNVLMIADTRGVDAPMTAVIQSGAKKVGITFKVRSVKGAYPVIQTPSKNIPISERPGWGKDYADASTFFEALFTSGAIIPSGNTNYSLVGLTPEIAEAVGAKGTIDGIPSVDADFKRCAVLIGGPRVACWAQLDRTLMTKVVPWVPWMSSNAISVTGPKVTKWAFDQFSGTIAYAHVAVKS